MIYIRQILEKKWEYSGTVHQLLIDFREVYDSILREVLYNILLEFCIDKKPLIVIKMCLKETSSEVRIGKFSSDKFFYSKWAEKGDTLLLLYHNFALEYAIKKVEEIKSVLN
jgi:hypothetical protein